ncbi:hypothetical protein CISIN_1g048421mg [Citrus sinensis]|uniref:Uncharacterized protein n=1 Tax=Citrus sinensis TaxID=2711 RepID=A0A067D0B0_CITSI|nr:hypothetical protein CISIN_1g048421mg [Citrus sinensis]
MPDTIDILSFTHHTPPTFRGYYYLLPCKPTCTIIICLKTRASKNLLRSISRLSTYGVH